MYYEWTVSEDYPDSLWLQYDSDIGPDLLIFREGRLVKNLRKPLRFWTQGRVTEQRLRAFDYLMTSVTELVSERFEKLIRSVCPACQFFPVDIRIGNAHLMGYSLLNISTSVPVIDMKKSKFKPMFGDGPPYEFKKVVTVPGALGVHHVARAEENTELAVVDQQFVDVCSKQNIRGAAFSRLL